MTAGACNSSNVIRELPNDPRLPDVAVSEAVKWAENKLSDLEYNYQHTYPWRKPS
jgi:hypothetical protein